MQCETVFSVLVTHVESEF